MRSFHPKNRRCMGLQGGWRLEPFAERSTGTSGCKAFTVVNRERSHGKSMQHQGNQPERHVSPKGARSMLSSPSIPNDPKRGTTGGLLTGWLHSTNSKHLLEERMPAGNHVFVVVRRR